MEIEKNTVKTENPQENEIENEFNLNQNNNNLITSY